MSPPSLHRHQHLVERVPCAREPIDSRAFIQSMRKEGPWHSIRPSASHVRPRAMAQAAGHTARRRRRGAPLPPPLAHQQHTRELRRWVSRRLAAGHVMSVGQVLGGAGRKRSLDDDELWRTSRHVSGGLGVRGGGVWRGFGEGRDRLHIRVSSSRSALAPPLVNSEQVCSVLSRVPCLTITDWCVVSDSEVRSSRVSNESSDVSCMNRKCGCGRVCLCGVLHESSHVGVSRDRLTRPIARSALGAINDNRKSAMRALSRTIDKRRRDGGCQSPYRIYAYLERSKSANKF